MPYGEKLKLIKKDMRLTNSQIRDLCSVPLATVTRLFDEKNQSGNFETFVALAKGLNFSLDELAGLKPHVQAPSSELLAEKDAQIEKLIDAIKVLREDNKTLRADSNALREDNKSLRRDKRRAIGVLVALLIALSAWFVVDLTNGHFGIFRF